MRSSISSLLAAALILALVPALPAQKAPAPPAPPKPKDELSSSSLVNGKSLDQWIQDLRSQDPSVRLNAIATVRLYGIHARTAVPTLIKLTQDRDVSVRVNAVIALGVIGMDLQDTPAGVQALTNLLYRDSQAIVRYQAATALGRLGPDARNAISGLVHALKDQFAWEIRRAAASALGNVAEDQNSGADPNAIKGLVAGLFDSSYMVRMESVLSLIVLGPPVAPTERAYVNSSLLQLTTKDRNKVVVVWAYFALMRMEKPTEPLLKALGKYLKDKDALVRQHCARALGSVGPDAGSQVPELVLGMKQEEDPIALYWMIWATGMIPDKERRAIPVLTSLQQHKEKAIQEAATAAIDKVKTIPKK